MRVRVGGGSGGNPLPHVSLRMLLETRVSSTLLCASPATGTNAIGGGCANQMIFQPAKKFLFPCHIKLIQVDHPILAHTSSTYHKGLP